MPKLAVVDSDSIFALYNPNDPLHASADKTLQRLVEEKYKLIYPSSVLFEIVSLFQRVLPIPSATAMLKDRVLSEKVTIFFVEGEILRESFLLFDPKGSKKNTLVDCSVVAIAKKLKADGVFSYDSFYTKQGLKLATDLVKL